MQPNSMTVILSERSESKDLRLLFWFFQPIMGGTQALKHRETWATRPLIAIKLR